MLPFASIGAVVALYVSGESLSVPASVGFIALWGIAVLNGVVLLSSIRKLRDDGMEQLAPFLFARGPGSTGTAATGGGRNRRIDYVHAIDLGVLPTPYGLFENKTVRREQLEEEMAESNY